MNRKVILKVFKLILISLALLNLIALFVFQYEVPSILGLNKNSSESTTPAPTQVAFSDYTFIFEPEALTYDNSSELDLLSGVSLVNPDGEPTDYEIFAHIATGDSLSEKKVIYTADTDKGQISAERALKLTSYGGPSIKLPTDFPEVAEAQLDSLLTLLPADNSLSADDGYGNDITSSVSVKYTIDPAAPTVAHFVFSVKNIFNDSVSVSADVTINSDRPTLVLTESKITITQNTAFQPLAYIQTAVDKNGNSISNRIRINNEVDLTTPGTYTVTYSVTDSAGNESLPQTLTVVVE